MFFVATLFTLLTYICMSRVGEYKKQLIAIDKSIKWGPPPRFAGILVCCLYYSFPLSDIIIRLYISFRLVVHFY